MGLLSALFGNGHQTPEVKFWKWFRANSVQLFNAPTAANHAFDQLKNELNKVWAGLTFEISRIENGKRELVISADGNRKAFPAVKCLVAAAPSMSNWYVTAFRPREPKSLSIDMGGIKLGPEDIWFAAKPAASGHGIDLAFAVRGMTQQNTRKYMPAVIILMDAAIGEYDAVMKVRGIRPMKLPEDPAGTGLHPFTSLPTLIDEVVVEPNA